MLWAHQIENMNANPCPFNRFIISQWNQIYKCNSYQRYATHAVSLIRYTHWTWIYAFVCVCVSLVYSYEKEEKKSRSIRSSMATMHWNVHFKKTVAQTHKHIHTTHSTNMSFASEIPICLCKQHTAHSAYRVNETEEWIEAERDREKWARAICIPFATPLLSKKMYQRKCTFYFCCYSFRCVMASLKRSERTAIHFINQCEEHEHWKVLNTHEKWMNITVWPFCTLLSGTSVTMNTNYHRFINVSILISIDYNDENELFFAAFYTHFIIIT